MFRKFILGKLGNTSAWIGVAIILCDIVQARMAILILGGLLIANDDAWFKDVFQRFGAWIAKQWPE